MSNRIKEILEELFEEKNSLSLILLKAKDIASTYGDTELVEFIEKQINGYILEDKLPPYRKLRAQIVADVVDVYGSEQYRQTEIDFSPLSEKIKIDLNEYSVYDEVSYIENSLYILSSTTALKEISQNLVKLLDETFHLNNPTLHLKKAFHKLATSSLRFILFKVRETLITKFQEHLQKASDNAFKIKNVENSSTPLGKKVFVTYAWENEMHNDQVISFVNFLRENGFDASMDRKHSQEESAINFSQMMIEGIQNSEKVIIVLTEAYKAKADSFSGGVGTEYRLIAGDIDKMKNKYILVSFGDKVFDDITPTGFSGREILDLKKDQNDNKFNTLFSKIKEESTIQFSEVNTAQIEIQKKEIKPFKL